MLITSRSKKEDDGRGSVNGGGGPMAGLEHLGDASVDTNLEAHREGDHLPEVTGLSYVEVMADVHRIERDRKRHRVRRRDDDTEGKLRNTT